MLHAPLAAFLVLTAPAAFAGVVSPSFTPTMGQTPVMPLGDFRLAIGVDWSYGTKENFLLLKSAYAPEIKTAMSEMPDYSGLRGKEARENAVRAFLSRAPLGFRERLAEFTQSKTPMPELAKRIAADLGEAHAATVTALRPQVHAWTRKKLEEEPDGDKLEALADQLFVYRFLGKPTQELWKGVRELSLDLKSGVALDVARRTAAALIAGLPADDGGAAAVARDEAMPGLAPSAVLGATPPTDRPAAREAAAALIATILEDPQLRRLFADPTGKHYIDPFDPLAPQDKIDAGHARMQVILESPRPKVVDDHKRSTRLKRVGRWLTLSLLPQYVGEDKGLSEYKSSPSGVTYYHGKEMAKNRVDVRGGRVFDRKGKPLHGVFDFNMDARGVIYASARAPSHTHASLIDGGDSAGAGEFAFYEGRLVFASPRTGHYANDSLVFSQLFVRLRERGVDASSVELIPAEIGNWDAMGTKMRDYLKKRPSKRPSYGVEGPDFVPV